MFTHSNKVLDSDGFFGKLYKIFKEEVIPSLHKFLPKMKEEKILPA